MFKNKNNKPAILQKKTDERQIAKEVGEEMLGEQWDVKTIKLELVVGGTSVHDARQIMRELKPQRKRHPVEVPIG